MKETKGSSSQKSKSGRKWIGCVVYLVAFFAVSIFMFVSNLETISRPEHIETVRRLHPLAILLEIERVKTGRYPEALEELEPMVLCGDHALNGKVWMADAWGNPLRYTYLDSEFSQPRLLRRFDTGYVLESCGEDDECSNNWHHGWGLGWYVSRDTDLDVVIRDGIWVEKPHHRPGNRFKVSLGYSAERPHQIAVSAEAIGREYSGQVVRVWVSIPEGRELSISSEGSQASPVTRPTAQSLCFDIQDHDWEAQSVVTRTIQFERLNDEPIHAYAAATPSSEGDYTDNAAALVVPTPPSTDATFSAAASTAMQSGSASTTEAPRPFQHHFQN